MNPEYIKLCSIPAVQEKIREGMGEWKAGDWGYKKSTIFGEEIDSTIWSEDDRFEVVIVRQKSSVPTYWHCTNEKGEERTLTDQQMMDTTMIHLPQVHDLMNEKRGLWGMCNPSKVDRQYTHCEVWYSVWFFDQKSGRHKRVDGDYIELALLRALCHQWKIEEVKV